MTGIDRATPVQQVLRCCNLLREGWHTKSHLARRLEVTDRTIKRYLAAIEGEQDGFEVREVDERGTREYRLRDVRIIDRAKGSPYEILALAMAERFFRAFDPGGVADLLDQMIFELTGEDEDPNDPDLIDRSLRGLGRRFVLARAPQPLSGDVRLVFDQLLRAVVDQRVVELSYERRQGGRRDYVFRPYTLLLGEAELAVIGAIAEPDPSGTARATDRIRTFALHRIRSITLRKQTFAMPSLSLWNPEAMFASSWGLYAGAAERVRLAVHPAFAELVRRRRWHPSQTTGEPSSDGWIPLTFDVFTGGEFRTWLLGWGPWLRVEKPARVAAWVTQMRSAQPGAGEPDSDEVFRIV
ncbi:MAG: WYL domain-containing protein [Deltaproteobacteria bacterium]|nr:WYL domain-containing protein [Deltaproteobacteria bacterium]